MEKKIIRSYNLFQFLYVFPRSFCFATYVLFLRENNLSFAEIGWVNFAFMSAMFVFEVPTGVIADFFGRKFSVIAGAAIETLGFFVNFFATGFWGFISAEIILALGASCVSGAIDAWVKDTLDANGSKKKIGVVFSQGEAFSRTAMILGGFLGAEIGNVSLRLTWLFCAVLSAVSTFIAFKLLDESFFAKRNFNAKESLIGMKNICRDSVKFGYQNKIVWTLIVVFAFYALGNQAVNIQWSVLFEKETGLASVGIILAVASVFYLAGTVGAGLLIQRNCSDRRLLFSSIFVNAAGIFLLTFMPNAWLMLSWYFVHEIGRGAFLPVQGHCLQNKIPAGQRATISSFNSMIAKAGSAVGWLGMGYLADWLSIRECWQISAVFFLIALLYVGRWPDKE